MSQRTLADWLAWQEQLHPSTIELGLARVKQVAARLPFFSASPKIKTIIVGGTNGKGSCVAYLEAILLEAGLRVGAYSSPHLLVYNERVRINGAMVSDQQLCDSFERVDRARRDAQGVETSLTYFEFGTLAALDIFQREHVDVQILEVGLGGRLDCRAVLLRGRAGGAAKSKLAAGDQQRNQPAASRKPMGPAELKSSRFTWRCGFNCRPDEHAHIDTPFRPRYGGADEP